MVAREAAASGAARETQRLKNDRHVASRITSWHWEGEPFISSHREGCEDVGEEDDAIRLVVPPRLKRNLRGQIRVLRPLPKGRVLRQRANKKRGNATKRVCSTPLKHTPTIWLTQPRTNATIWHAKDLRPDFDPMRTDKLTSCQTTYIRRSQRRARGKNGESIMAMHAQQLS